MNTRATVWADTASQPINPFTLCLERFLQPPLQKKLEKKKKTFQKRKQPKIMLLPDPAFYITLEDKNLHTSPVLAKAKPSSNSHLTT